MPKAATNKLKMAPLSPDSEIDMPTANPARIVLMNTWLFRLLCKAASARNDIPSPVAQLGKPQAPLEKKFPLSAAAKAHSAQTQVLKPSSRKSNPAHNPKTN